MEEKNLTRTIPRNIEGEEINAENTIEFDQLEQAVKMFEIAKRRLVDVNNWNTIAPKLIGNFQLIDSAACKLHRFVQEGDYFRIDLPGPGAKAGGGYDWVVVERVEFFQDENAESIAIRVRPASNPLDDGNETAHFYSEISTSTFTVTRKKTQIIAAVYDRNIKGNGDSEKATDRLRNLLTAAMGQVLFSKLEWNTLTEALVRF